MLHMTRNFLVTIQIGTGKLLIKESGTNLVKIRTNYERLYPCSLVNVDLL